ncbi:MAG: DNA polymerase III subunit delta [Acidimicrobiales bacterium]
MAPIHLVKGSDDVLREEAVTSLVDALVGDGDRSILVDEFAGSEYELDEAVDAAQTLPFLTDRRVVVIRHLGRFARAELQAPLLAYLERPLSSTDLVLVWERSPEPGAKFAALPPKLGQALKAAAAEVTEVDPPQKGRDAWVGEQFRIHDLVIDGAGRERIAERLGENPGAVLELIERLVGVFGAGARLTVDDVEPLLGQAGGVPPWELTDAIDRGNTAAALDRLHRMMGGGDKHPLQVMASLHGHFTRMLRLDGARIRGEKEAATVLGLRGSTFPARKALSQGRKLGSTGVARAVGLLAQADLDLRGAQSWPDELVMEVLVARLSKLAPARGR